MIYTGAFFNQTFETKLDKKIAFPHVTCEFKPTSIDYSLFGKEISFRVIGYGINEENEGYLVEIENAPKELRNAFKNVETLHVTIGISNNGKAVNTKNLNFQPCKNFILKGRFGGFEKNKIFF